MQNPAEKQLPIGCVTGSPWLGLKLMVTHLSCRTKSVLPMNRPIRCKSLLQTMVYAGILPFLFLNAHLSKLSCALSAYCSTMLPVLRCPLHGPSGSDSMDYRKGFKITLLLAPKWYIQGKKGYLIITIWVLTLIQTLKQVIKVGNVEKGSNKFELVQHSPSTLQELQTHPQYDVETNK